MLVNRRRYILYRLTWTVVGAWGALTTIFLAFALTPDPNQYCLGSGCRELYREARNYDVPIHERYFSWMESLLRLDLGTTVRGEPITGVLGDASLVTGLYLVPAVVFAVVVGVGVGTYVAMNPESRLLRAVRGASYLGFAVPTFVAAEALFLVAEHWLQWYNFSYEPKMALFTGRNLAALVLPGLVLTVNLLAVQLRYAQSESVEILQEDFVRTLRATGADTTDFARHVLKNAASSLLSLFFSELVGVMFVVVVVVEVIFGVPGVGSLLFEAIQNRDAALILSTTIFPILLVMFGNLLQDVAYVYIDPRVEVE
ncbi:ABC transporter permease [Halorussus gelatinilyticus]|uniref:ABC transporter permease n=1 Tax=Halorussus gelatinilyticus TaxID=2937524 RepID=A0A8U0IDC2_9EURY|nr:ABC transporter permease [Halorussus gelatinilyticus]UPV98764.1 ABC transporter permease [Halorussus gelatinilyticus]